MGITAADLKFIASERMIDNLSSSANVGGGGPMSQTLIVDGTENNVFPDVMPGDRTSGASHLRQIYPIALSNENDSLFNASVGIGERPSDANVEITAFTATGTLSYNAAGALGTKWTAVDAGTISSGNITPGSNQFDLYLGQPVPPVGSLVRVRTTTTAVPGGLPSVTTDMGLRLVTAVAGDLVTFDGSANGAGEFGTMQLVLGAGAGTRVSALSLSTDARSAADTTVTVDKLWAAVQLPGSSSLDTAGEPAGRSGTLPLYLPGDVVLIEHATVPATRELITVSSVNYATGVITFSTGLANAYPIGSKVTRPVGLGTLQARANNIFAQQTWTRTWSDVLIGSGIGARYSGTPTMVNEGGVTDRWAVVFTSATAFNLLSERLGQIASGVTTVNFAPLNPMTNQPYFTLLAAGWGSGWLPGNTLRFNTQAASQPVWLNRLVKPSSPAGSVQATLFMRGDVNA